MKTHCIFCNLPLTILKPFDQTCLNHNNIEVVYHTSLVSIKCWLNNCQYNVSISPVHHDLYIFNISNMMTEEPIVINDLLYVSPESAIEFITKMQSLKAFL